MEAGFPGERHTDLACAGPHPLIRAVEVVVPVETAVEYFDQPDRERVTDRKPAAAEGHSVRVHHVLLHALRAPSDVPQLPVVVSALDLTCVHTYS